MNVEEVGSPPLATGHGEGLPPSPYKRPPTPSSHLAPPPREGSLLPLIIPHGLGLARYMFPVALHLEGVAASAASLERGGGGCSVDRTCVRSQMHC